MACSCDYSYTCGECQAKIDAANAADYANEIRNWMIEVIKELSKKLDLVVPEPPKRRY